MDFSVSRNENEKRQKDRQIHGSCYRAEKAVEYKGDIDTNCRWLAWNSHQKPRKRDCRNWKSVEELRLYRF